jgi:hypothetical protein
MRWEGFTATSARKGPAPYCLTSSVSPAFGVGGTLHVDPHHLPDEEKKEGEVPHT